MERLDPETGAWQAVARMATARSHFGVAVLDGFIYVLGGMQGGWGQLIYGISIVAPLCLVQMA